MAKMGDKKNKSVKRELLDGTDLGLQSMESIDINKCKNSNELLKAMSKTAFTGRITGEAADVLYDMFTDEKCFTVLTLAGAMTVAKQGMIITELIDRNLVHAVVSTGALMTHGFVEGAGKTHFKHDPKYSDKHLFNCGMNRVYDSVEPEKNLDDIEEIMQKILGSFDEKETLCSHKVTNAIGKYLDKNVKGRTILGSAYRKGVPVYVPAFTDSEMGLDFEIFNIKRKIAKKPQIQFNPFLDLQHYARLYERQERTGILTIGGGVPRNWAQQVIPFIDIRNKRVGMNSRIEPFSYGVRICPEPAFWGGLSGCTYSEGVSWGKFKADGKFAEVMLDATVGLPLIASGVLQRLDEKKIKVKKNFRGIDA